MSCTALKGDLVTIYSEEENFFVKNISQRGFNYWIGLMRINGVASFKWTDGTSLSYSRWSTGEPSNAEDPQSICTTFKSGYWFSSRCDYDKYYPICKIKFA
ncbi:Low affinity immunoglobulin epsilon Fc receptor-like protein [Leptotrombidium deliense]|uniref:Low affinity immunoglobulin epsilon Fc receptor-like protein n=1 Tax=Leptotrombidium deliense TaxID=299467 RepID=A0A443S1E3_9ACAR|nr:Low affinity immunoglobulin epsilon Fc receptor-like protein [Leptotrombidium deliense]